MQEDLPLASPVPATCRTFILKHPEMILLVIIHTHVLYIFGSTQSQLFIIFVHVTMQIYRLTVSCDINKS